MHKFLTFCGKVLDLTIGFIALLFIDHYVGQLLGVKATQALWLIVWVLIFGDWLTTPPKRWK